MNHACISLWAGKMLRDGRKTPGHSQRFLIQKNLQSPRPAPVQTDAGTSEVADSGARSLVATKHGKAMS